MNVFRSERRAGSPSPSKPPRVHCRGGYGTATFEKDIRPFKGSTLTSKDKKFKSKKSVLEELLKVGIVQFRNENTVFTAFNPLMLLGNLLWWVLGKRHCSMLLVPMTDADDKKKGVLGREIRVDAGAVLGVMPGLAEFLREAWRIMEAQFENLDQFTDSKFSKAYKDICRNSRDSPAAKSKSILLGVSNALHDKMSIHHNKNVMNSGERSTFTLTPYWLCEQEYSDFLTENQLTSITGKSLTRDLIYSEVTRLIKQNFKRMNN